MKNKLWVSFLCIAVCIASGSASAYTLGQSVGISSSPNPVGSGARAVGMGGAFIGVADDATAASWNPAGLIQLETPEISLVGAYAFKSEDFSAAAITGREESFDDEEGSINYFSASYPVNLLNRNMVFSLNYQRLYDFKRTFNYQLFESTGILTTRQDRSYRQEGFLSALGLAYAVQLTPRISAGLTLNIWTSQLGWKNGWDEKYANHSVTTIGLTTSIEDSVITEAYDDLRGVNANLGVLWNVTSHLTIGAILKTPFAAKFDHRFTDIWEQRNGSGTLLNASRLTIVDETELWMPMSYGLGGAWRFSDAFTLDLDVYRTRWSEYILTDGQGNQMSPISALPKDQSDVEDTTQVRLGMEYLIIRPETKLIVPLRAGVFYDPEPAEGKVKDFYGVSVGSGVGYGRFIFDVAYQLRWGDDVDSANLIGASKADIRQHLVLCSFILHF